MAEVIEIENKGGHQLLLCRKRKLEILVTERFDIPDYPKDMVIVFGAVSKSSLPNLNMGNNLVICFAIPNYGAIEYEPYFRHLLVTNAMEYFVNKEWGVSFDEITYSSEYQKRFIDTMSLEPGKMTPELRAYMSSDVAEEQLDFFEWKEKHMKPFLN